MNRVVKEYSIGTAGDNATTRTVPGVTSFGQNRALVVLAFGSRNAGGQAPTGVTWNGHSLIKAVDEVTDGDAIGTASMWYLEAPEQATDDVVVTWANNHLFRSVMVLLLNDAEQSSITDGTGTAHASSPSITTSQNGSLGIQATLFVPNSGFTLVSFDYSNGQTQVDLTVSTISTSGAYLRVPTAGTQVFGIGFTTTPAVGGKDESCTIVCGFKELNGNNPHGGNAYLGSPGYY